MTPKPRILLVDDDVMIVELISTILIKLGYDVVTTNNALSALKIFKNDQSFDCVITDYLMPVMTGLTLVAEIRKIDTTRSIPVIMHTGYIDVDIDIVKSMLSNVSFLLKPCSRINIHDAVRAAIHGK